jgi:hypothetical protein
VIGPSLVWNFTSLAVNTALRVGLRGLPGGSSLAEVLRVHQGHRNKSKLPALTEVDILEWAQAHQARTGRLPNSQWGWVTPYGETWKAVDMALRQGLRGLLGGSSLFRLMRSMAGRGRFATVAAPLLQGNHGWRHQGGRLHS